MDNKLLDAALLAARLDCESVYKDSKGNRGKYVKLPAWLNMVIPILGKHRIRFEQPTVFEGGFVLLKTRLIHVDTHEFTESVFPLDIGELKSTDQKEHKECGIQTYHRRYQLTTLLGLCGEDDDQDGYVSKSTPSNDSNLITEKQYNYLMTLLVGKEGYEDRIRTKYNVTDVSLLTKADAKTIIDSLTSKDK
jgi:hypothetical protein